MISKLLIALTLLCSLVALLVCGAGYGYLDQPIKAACQFYLNHQGLKTEINHLHFSGNQLSVTSVVSKLPDQISLMVSNLKVVFNFSGTIRAPLINAKISAGNVTIITKDHPKLLSAKLTADYQLNLFSAASLVKVNSEVLCSDLLGPNVPSGSASLTYQTQSTTNQDQHLDCQLNFGDKAFLLLSGQITDQDIIAHGTISNIPIMIYQIVQKLMPGNEIISCLHQYVRAGHITSGKFDLSCNKNFAGIAAMTAENFSGKFQITDLEFKYHPDIRPLTKIDMVVLITGPAVQCILNKAYINNTSLSNGLITIDWQGFNATNIVVNALSCGPAADLVDFIPKAAQQKMIKQGIDLTKLTGMVEGKIKVVVPISCNTSNIYNITAHSADLGLTIFDGKITLRDGKMTGLFTGSQLTIESAGKINNLASNLVYHYDLSNPKINQQSLKVQTKFTGYQKLGPVTLLSGQAVIDFEYQQRNDQSSIQASSNLQNLAFSIDKISIYKPAGAAAYLTLGTDKTTHLGGYIDFKLTGDDDLKIIGNLQIDNNQYQLHLPVISHYQTNLNAQIALNPDNLTAKIRGNMLDLSQSNMMQFLEKTGNHTSTNLDVKIAKVQLKRNIALDNFQLEIKCDKIRCYDGYLDAKIATKSVTMLIKQIDDQEQWSINCDDAGAILQGFGIYNNMRRGNMSVVVSTARHLVASGELIPIINGKFSFEKFASTDQSFLVQVLSLPGLAKMLTNDKNIEFVKMRGNFSYLGSIIKISKTSAKGPYSDFTMAGTIDTTNRQIDLGGKVTLSVYGISTLLKNIPLVGKILLPAFPYSIKKKY